jgi:hypothetical protein
MKGLFCFAVFAFISTTIYAQPRPVSLSKGKYGDGPDSIAPVGVIKGLSDGQLMETIQRQTFRFFWHGAHSHSGLALERSNTVLAFTTTGMQRAIWPSIRDPLLR